MLPSSIELTYFFEVATTLSFTQAAVKLNVSQPSLSIAIKRLEDQLSQCLFIRHKQGVTLTRAGQALFKEVKNLLGKWTEVLDSVRSAHSAIKGHVNLGCNSTLVPFISPLLSNLMTEFPSLEINLKHELTYKIIEDIIQGHLDIGFVVDPTKHPDIILNKIMDIEFTLWSAQKNVDLKNINSETTIVCNSDLPQTQYLLREIRKVKNINLRLSTTNQLESVATMAINGNNISILPSCFVEALHTNKLFRVEHAPSCLNTMYLACNAQNREVAVTQAVWQALKKW